MLVKQQKKGKSILINVNICRRFCVVAESFYHFRHVFRHSLYRLSFRLSARVTAFPTRRIFVKFDIGDFCRASTYLFKTWQKYPTYYCAYRLYKNVELLKHSKNKDLRQVNCMSVNCFYTFYAL